jgi:HSP90 family molecular chaperone
MEAMSHNQTLEINSYHPIIVKLNELRKVDSKRASHVSKQMLDSVLLQSGIPHDMNKSATRNLMILDQYLQMKADRVNL